MNSWIDYIVKQEQHRDLLRAAEQERLVRAALAGRPKRTRVFGPPLVWLGKRLIAWGRRLQARPGAREAHSDPAFDGGG